MPPLLSSLRFLSLKHLISANRTTRSSVPFSPITSLAMESQSSCILILRGKSAAEDEFAKSLKNNHTLKLPEIDDVSIRLHSEIEKKPSVEENGCFCMDSYMNSLSTNRFGQFLIWSPRLPSTHDVVSHNFCELPLGAVCVADIQYKGRGRSKNVWESPMGCLLFSFTLQMENGLIVPVVQHVVSIAMTEAIKDVCDANGLPHLDVKIKWPNDLYLNNLKVGGILCTSTYKSKKFNVSAGVGLNIDNEKPTTCLNAALQELSSRVFRLRREDILACFFNKFETFFGLLINQGFHTLRELYQRTWLHSGQKVTIQENHNGQMVETVVTIQGLTASGYLLAMGEDYQMYELNPDGNRYENDFRLLQRFGEEEIRLKNIHRCLPLVAADYAASSVASRPQQRSVTSDK